MSGGTDGTGGTGVPAFRYALRRVVRTFWASPLVAILSAAAAYALCRWTDAAGGDAWLASLHPVFAVGASSADDLASSLVTVLVTLLTVFFSITLLVITLAASNLGVRLIDRWMDRRMLSGTLGLLVGLLTFALLLQADIDPDRAVLPVPRVALAMAVLATVLVLGWMTVAFDHLSRMVHVDTSVAALGRDLAAALSAGTQTNREGHGEEGGGQSPGGHDRDEAALRTFTVDEGVYVESVDAAALVRLARTHRVRIAVAASVGSFLFPGDALVRVYAAAGPPAGTDGHACLGKKRFAKRIQRAVVTGPFRSDQEGAAFRARLLAEVAARALSPAVNDLYTAMACVDHLGAGCMAAARAGRPADGFYRDGRKVLTVPGRHWTQIIEPPLQVLRQASADDPPVTLRLLTMLGRVVRRRAGAADDRDFLAAQADAVVEQALDAITIEIDREAIRNRRTRAFAVRMRPMRSFRTQLIQCEDDAAGAG